MLLSGCDNNTNASNNEEMPVYINKLLPTPNEGNYDSEGIIMYDYGQKIDLQYNPLFISNDAISFYNDYYGYPVEYRQNPEYIKFFYKYIDWLADNSTFQNGIGRLVPYNFDSDLGGKAPWYSAITQARVAKAFTLAYKESGDEKYLRYTHELLQPLFIDISKGGLLHSEENIYFFEEYINPPDHSLNGHMSVILNLFEVNEVLDDNEIKQWIERGTQSLITVLPLYEMYNDMAFADKSLQGGNFDNFVPSETFMRSYDQIHIYYFEQLYKWTGNEIFKDYFYKYYAMLAMKPIFKLNTNILSNTHNSAVMDLSSFFETPHDLYASFNNSRFDFNKYTAGNTGEDEAYFEIKMNEAKSIDVVKIQFRYPDYPRDFNLSGWSDGKWHTLFLEEDYEGFVDSTSLYIFNYQGHEKFEKIKFTASNFEGQQRLLLGHFSIKEKFTNSDIIETWSKYYSDTEIWRYIGNDVLKNCSNGTSSQNINECMINIFAQKLDNDIEDFWTISRPIIDSLSVGEISFEIPEK